LTAPIPGLTDLYAGGTFFACAPYGTCWQPLGESTGAEQTATEPTAQPGRATIDAKQKKAPKEQSPGGIAQPALPGAGFVPQAVNFDAILGGCPFPLWDDWTAVANTPAQFADLSYRAYMLQEQQGWFWPVCHFSSWIYHGGHYVVVVRGRPRRHCVWWVKVGNQVAIVPPHPTDRAGLPPRNLRHGALIPIAEGKSGKIVSSSYDPNEKVVVLSSPPKQFRNVSVPVVTTAPAPVITGRLLENPAGLKNASTKAAEPKITYNYEKGQFMQEGREVGGRTAKATAIRSLSSRGGFARGTSGYLGNSHASSGYRGGGGAGGSRSYGGGAAGRSSGGGGGTAGRSYGGGGGASHSYGGGGGMSGGSHGGGGGSGAGGGGSTGHK
jgi:hypothetical protein